jgi:hypothetical protein
MGDVFPSRGFWPKDILINCVREFSAMKYSRRDMIKFGGLTVISSLGLSGAAIGQRRLFESDLLLTLGARSFRPLVGTYFYLSAGEFSETAILDSITELSPKTKRGECFILDFEINTDEAQQAVYQMFHPELGNFEMLLVPGRRTGKSIITATVNRI